MRNPLTEDNGPDLPEPLKHFLIERPLDGEVFRVDCESAQEAAQWYYCTRDSGGFSVDHDIIVHWLQGGVRFSRIVNIEIRAR